MYVHLATELLDRMRFVTMRAIRLIFGLIALGLLLPGATLERLSMDDLSLKSTDIVRARIGGTRTAFRGSVIYTFYSLQVLDRWKGGEAATLDVGVPGGSIGDLRQVFSGVPSLVPGSEYLLFLWTGPSGTTQIMGLSQGVFDIRKETSGATVAVRAPSSGLMLDPATHRVIQDAAMRIDLTDFRNQVSAVLARGASR